MYHRHYLLGICFGFHLRYPLLGVLTADVLASCTNRLTLAAVEGYGFSTSFLAAVGKRH